MNTRIFGVVLVTLASTTPLHAQLLADESHAAMTVEAGLFMTGRDRYAGDVEVGAHAGVGFRWQTHGLFGEPQLRVMIADHRGSEIPMIWPALNAAS